MDSLLDRASAYFLNMPGRDRAPDFMSAPDELTMRQTPMAPLVAFNGKAPNLMETDISEVPPLAAVAPNGNVIPVQNIEADLRQLRSEMPFLHIVSRPQAVTTLFFAAGNAPQNVDVPGNVSLVRFRGNLDYYVNFDGTASVPTVGVPATGTLYRPEGQWYYCGGLNQVSIVAAAVNTIVTLEFIGRRQQG